MKMNRSLLGRRWLTLHLLLFATVFSTALVRAQSPGPGNAVSFDGVTGSFAQTPHSAALDAYPLTVTAWFRTTQTLTNAADQMALVNKYVASSFNGYQVYIDATGIHAWYFVDAGNNVYGALDGGPVADSRWHHVAL